VDVEFIKTVRPTEQLVVKRKIKNQFVEIKYAVNGTRLFGSEPEKAPEILPGNYFEYLKCQFPQISDPSWYPYSQTYALSRFNPVTSKQHAKELGNVLNI